MIDFQTFGAISKFPKYSDNFVEELFLTVFSIPVNRASKDLRIDSLNITAPKRNESYKKLFFFFFRCNLF